MSRFVTKLLIVAMGVVGWFVHPTLVARWGEDGAIGVGIVAAIVLGLVWWPIYRWWELRTLRRRIADAEGAAARDL